MSSAEELSSFRYPFVAQDQRTASHGTLKKPAAPFVAGPIPLAWLMHAVRCGGSAPAVVVALLYFRGLRRSVKVTVPRAFLESVGVSRGCESRALSALEARHLIAVDRHSGRRPRITVLFDAVPSSGTP